MNDDTSPTSRVEPEDRLADLDLPALDASVRARTLAETSRHVRRRRYRARFAQFAALFLAFVAGALVMLPRQPAAPNRAIELPQSASTIGVEPAASAEADPGTALFDDPEALAFAYDATDDNGKLELLKAAGDHELNANQDIRAALDYYRQWITLADASTRQIYDETDTWLLASLKHEE